MNYMRFIYIVFISCLVSIYGFVQAADLLRVQKIWGKGEHNAFTDLIRINDEWLCVFREGKGHVSPDGGIRIIGSKDGTNWSSIAYLESKTADLRDPKIILTPKGELMLYAAAALPKGSDAKHQSLAWFSRDGKTWGDPTEIGEKNVWIWRVIWGKSEGYAVGYDTAGEKFARLYRSEDGKKWTPVVEKLFAEGYPNESGLVWLEDGSLACLLRRDGSEASGKFGVARPPFSEWTWKDVGPKIGGPQMIRLPNGRLIAGVRLYDGGARTSIVEIDRSSGKLQELIKLPSGGDCSYPGLVWHNDRLYVSYYSSHEGKTQIYFAETELTKR